MTADQANPALSLTPTASTGAGWSSFAAWPHGWEPTAVRAAGPSGPRSTGILMSTSATPSPGRPPRLAPELTDSRPAAGRRARPATGGRPPGGRPPGQPGAGRPQPAGPALGRRRLGRELRQLREARWLRLEDVADRLGVAPSTLSRIESGKAPTRTGYLALMLDLYDIDDPAQRASLEELARQGQRDGWWTDYSDLL